jgi:hypothetical protein
MTDRKTNKKETEPETRLKEVHKTWGSAEAEVVKTFLASHGIPCFFKSLVVQSVHPFTADGLGEIKIFVKDTDFETAKKLLASRQ